jgi:hypothetical protein
MALYAGASFRPSGESEHSTGSLNRTTSWAEMLRCIIEDRFALLLVQTLARRGIHLDRMGVPRKSRSCCLELVRTIPVCYILSSKSSFEFIIILFLLFINPFQISKYNSYYLSIDFNLGEIYLRDECNYDLLR